MYNELFNGEKFVKHDSKRKHYQKRTPAYRATEHRWYHKPLVFGRDRWRQWQSFSTKKKLAIVGGTTAVFLIVFPTASYFYFVRDINDRERLMNRNNTGIVMTDRHDEVFYSFGKSATEKFYKLDEIADEAENALIASEDKDFFEHGGFSLRSMAGALTGNLLNLELTKYGGSTITQQLVKNNLLTDKKNYLRKYQELSIAIAIERQYTKDEILELYLNSVYYGEGAFGIEQAARTYFDKLPAELSLGEASMLIGLLPAPSAYSPISGDIEQSKQQQERVLTAMSETGYITNDQADNALEAELAYADIELNDQKHAHHFSRMVMAELEERYGEEQVTRSGFRVRTTIDLKQQEFAEQTVAEQIELATSQGATNGALVAMNPENGEVNALVGSADWDNESFGQVNMATSPRQPGSSFKPIYYAEALDQRLITGATVIRDERVEYGEYVPENYDFNFRGDITARYALGNSLNIPSIKIIEDLGVEEAVSTAQRMGISDVTDPEAYGLTLALGTAETKLLDMTNAYAAFANLGVQHKPTTILSIKDKFGSEAFKAVPAANRVQSAAASYMISSILSDERARAATFGTRLNIFGREVAVKTGSTNENKDAWTIGYTPSLVVGVWVGDNNNQPMQAGGSAMAGPIWKSTMEHILQDSQTETFPIPGEVSQIYVCTVNGNYEEYFFNGYTPEAQCERPSDNPGIVEPRRSDEEEERLRQEAEEESNVSPEEEQDTEPIFDEETDTEETPTDGTDGLEEAPPPEEDESNIPGPIIEPEQL